MKIPSQLLLTVILLVPTFMAYAGSLSPADELQPVPEPRYQDRSLTEWLNVVNLYSGSLNTTGALARAETAIRAIGSAAIPRLLADLQSRGRAPEPGITTTTRVTMSERQHHAWRAFMILGPAAAPAVPELLQLLVRNELTEWVLRILGSIGPAAGTPEAVAAVANCSGNSNPYISRYAVETLASWGPLASNAIPQLLLGLRTQTKAGGPNRSAARPPSPDYARALARIAPDSREVLIELLAAKASVGTHSPLNRWSENSKNRPTLVRNVVMDPAISMPIRLQGIWFLTSTKDTNLLSDVEVLLREKELRYPIIAYLRSVGTNGTSIFPILIKAAVRYGYEDVPVNYQFGHNPPFALQCWLYIGDFGHSQAANLIPQLLPLTFDERYPFGYSWSGKGPVPTFMYVKMSIDRIAGGRDQLVPMVIAALHHPDWQVRNASAALLWGHVDFPPPPPLPMPGYPNRQERNASPPRPLVPSGFHQEAKTALGQCLQDTNEMVRLSAAVALVRSPEYKQQVISELLAAVASPTLSSLLRLRAIGFLQRFRVGQDHPEAVHILTAALKDPEMRIRETAAQMLSEMEQPAGEDTKRKPIKSL